MSTTTSTRVLACACLATLAGARTADAQAFKSGVDLVALTVTVTDQRGRGIDGLTADRFAVYDEGVRQPVSLFSSAQVPIDVALVLDTSGSMEAILPVLKRGAGRLLGKLRDGDRALVLDVKERIEIHEALTAHLAAVKTSLASLRSAGDTALYDGMYMALQEFARVRRLMPELRRQALVVFSDGLDTASHVQFADLLALARSSDVTIYTLTLHDPRLLAALDLVERSERSAWEMGTLTRETGGVAFFPDKPFELERAFEVIAGELMTQYALAYAAPAGSDEGTFRRVSVQLLLPAGGIARTRAGYVPRQMRGTAAGHGSR